MKIVAIIQARMSSTRFPGKVLMPLAGKPVIWHIAYRLRKCKMIDTIALAITTNASDDPLEEFALKEGIEVIRGSEDNVLERYYITAKELNADIVVRVTGDAPLIDPDCIDYLINYLIENKVDYVTGDPSIPSIHEGFSPLTFNALKKLFIEKSDNPVAKEHVTGYFNMNPDFVSYAYILPLPEHQFSGARMSVDTPSDLRFLEEIYKRLGVLAGEANITDVVKLLQKNPDLLHINSHVYQKKADDKTCKILFYMGHAVNYLHKQQENFINLAEKLRDNFGLGITFVINADNKDIEAIRKAGFHVEVNKSNDKEKCLDTIIKNVHPDIILFDSNIYHGGERQKTMHEEGIIMINVEDLINDGISGDKLEHEIFCRIKSCF